ncbi:Uncharacterised protein [Legionella steigerwaltii]|uniref:Uncharacterized protein n=1 Tax=Legionella steigerwaltii TaxID=460 RepID=A0A378L8P6_9GAMM|nr:hypothetical protein [Legionella steigerwaltii]KTD81118.1 hypothetical protein Lstg_0345 [Legionella steigerwaltii]STY23193.1 Uncharacterised protein [Legionella steigerwaltii]
MSGKSLSDWRKKWESFFKKNKYGLARCNNELDAVKKMLFEYAGAFAHTPLGQPYAWGGMFGRFLWGRWGTNHGSAVEKALHTIHYESFDDYMNMNSYVGEDYHERIDGMDVEIHIIRGAGTYYTEKLHGNIIRTLNTHTENIVDFSPSPTAQIQKLLQEIKKNIDNKKMKPDGDLHRILTVIEEKTGISYSNIDLVRDYYREENLKKIRDLKNTLESAEIESLTRGDIMQLKGPAWKYQEAF